MNKIKSSMSLYNWISLSFTVLIILLALSISVSLWQVKKTSNTTMKLVNIYMPTVQNSQNLLDGIDRAIADMRGWLITPNPQFRVLWAATWENQIKPSMDRYEQLGQQLPIGNAGMDTQQMRQSLEKLRASQNEIMDLAITDKPKAVALFYERVNKLVLPLRDSLASSIDKQNKQMASSIETVKEAIILLNMLQWGLLITGVIAGLILSSRLSKFISAPVVQLANTAEAIAQGDLQKPVELSGSREIQQLGMSINKMIETMRTITLSAKKISEGDYLLTLTPRSENDELLLALNNMTSILAKNKLFYEEQAWLQKGSNQLLLCISKFTELNQLCSESLDELCRYLDAGIGALYLFEPENEHLKLITSFAHTEREFIANQFKMGEGIVGQVGLERKPILLKNITRKNMVITSGTTEEAPLNTYAFPLVDKQQLVGVIEIAFHEQLTPLKMNYIENSTPLLSSNIRICEQKEETERLLESQRVLTEELQVQQEELKASNEELEAQTEELKSSEEELRVNEEEQRSLNQALEERNKLLQDQAQSLKAAQDDLLEKTKQIQQSSKYKSEFLANMSHELRTPLNSLLLLSKMLADNKEKNLNEEQIESLTVIHRSGMELLQLINDVLDLAKVEAGKLNVTRSEIKVADFIDIIKSDFQAVAKDKNLEFKTDIAQGTSPKLYTDEQRLKQIIKNLLSNAFKFTEKGSITLKVHQPEAEQLKSTTLTPQNCLAFSVIDTGIGIAKDKQEQVFQTFFQGDGNLNRKYNGAGLGLSISAQLAKLLEGELSIHSEIGDGSTFTLFIPTNEHLEKEMPVTEKTIISKNNNPQLAAETILACNTKKNKVLLIIEDDIQFAKILTDACTKKGYHCKHAPTGAEGIKLAEEFLPVCIFLDVNLPDMNGLSVADKIKANDQTKDIPIHFISGSDKSDDAMKHGAASYLLKPISIEKLDLAIESVAHSINDKISRLLVVEDDEVLRKQIQKSYEEKSITVLGAGTGKEALNLLKSQQFDCMVLDLGLPDISGFELLQTINASTEHSHPAVIVYTGKEFTESDHLLLQNYSKNIIIKGKASMERLLDESALFLHQVEKSTPLMNEDSASSTEMKNHLQGKKLLVVDDDMRNTFSLAKIMNEFGIDTVIAPNGKMALEMLHKGHDYDGILMDIMMPVLDGFDTITQIRRVPKFNTLPIIALTAKSMPTDREKCLQLGATDYMSKPVDVNKLLILLRAYLCQ